MPYKISCASGRLKISTGATKIAGQFHQTSFNLHYLIFKEGRVENSALFELFNFLEATINVP